MAMNDTLATALCNIMNAEREGKQVCVVTPVSKLMKKVFEIMKDNHFIGEYTEIKNGKGNLIEVNLIGGINKCGVIKPRFSVTKDEYTKFEKRFLPALNFGLIILSTSQGIMTLSEAKEKDIGGKLLAFIY
ncbi:30S ribosomal protein S8 [archaeon]|jgi:small subunit ribosomal protein S8|nr:30S ribosomal protein S8 [archaeon]MBT3730919.1 30S ribosomal protein S8 [archaeon]MBT4669842.1 30S ribosomal protein S8 [archaeon]MBT5029994.1 30S ribosomal protein S8 [archaeon]MBT5288095.1 30S ribosomal protein S8 [archaeon]